MHANEKKRLVRLYKMLLDSCMKDYKANPSAKNYLTMQNAMISYQELVKNTEVTK